MLRVGSSRTCKTHMNKRTNQLPYNFPPNMETNKTPPLRHPIPSPPRNPETNQTNKTPHPLAIPFLLFVCIDMFLLCASDDTETVRGSLFCPNSIPSFYIFIPSPIIYLDNLYYLFIIHICPHFSLKPSTPPKTQPITSHIPYTCTHTPTPSFQPTCECIFMFILVFSMVYYSPNVVGVLFSRGRR